MRMTLRCLSRPIQLHLRGCGVEWMRYCCRWHRGDRVDSLSYDLVSWFACKEFDIGNRYQYVSFGKIVFLELAELFFVCYPFSVLIRRTFKVIACRQLFNYRQDYHISLQTQKIRI